MEIPECSTHTQICKNLNILTKSLSTFPNMIIHGPEPSNIERFLKMLIKTIFPTIADEVCHISYHTYMSYGKKKTICLHTYPKVIHVIFNESFHLESDFLTFLLQELGGRCPSKDITGGEYYKLVVFHNIDSLLSVQAPMCKFIDEMNSYVRFIFTTKSLIKLSESLCSRCMFLKIPSMSKSRQLCIIKKICSCSINENEFDNTNITTNMLKAQCLLNNIEIGLLPWNQIINNICDIVFATRLKLSLLCIKNIRQMYYNLRLYGLVINNILKEIIKKIVLRMKNNKIHLRHIVDILNIGAEHIYNSYSGNKGVFYVESFVIHSHTYLQKNVTQC